MYKGFNLQVDFSAQEIAQFSQAGIRHLDTVASGIKINLRRLVFEDGTIDAAQLQHDWFPDVNVDVFISHSHQDTDQVIALSGFLNSVFGLRCFVDSIVWNYSEDLQKLLDDKFCWQPLNNTYNYSKRNVTTSHVHMLLASSLIKMIDKTESMMFLNTPQSVTILDQMNKTHSPWIYFEIGMSNWIRPMPLSVYRKKIKTRRYSDHFEKGILNESIEYPLDLDHLTPINRHNLVDWQDKYAGEHYALDVLYRLIYESSI